MSATPSFGLRTTQSADTAWDKHGCQCKACAGRVSYGGGQPERTSSGARSSNDCALQCCVFISRCARTFPRPRRKKKMTCCVRDYRMRTHLQKFKTLASECEPPRSILTWQTFGWTPVLVPSGAFNVERRVPPDCFGFSAPPGVGESLLARGNIGGRSRSSTLRQVNFARAWPQPRILATE